MTDSLTFKKSGYFFRVILFKLTRGDFHTFEHFTKSLRYT